MASAQNHVAVGQNQWYHFGVGEFTTHFRLPILVVGLNRMFTWGYGILDFDPWSVGLQPPLVLEETPAHCPKKKTKPLPEKGPQGRGRIAAAASTVSAPSAPALSCPSASRRLCPSERLPRSTKPGSNQHPMGSWQKKAFEPLVL